MSKNPAVNALAGLLYIVLVVSFLYNAPAFLGKTQSIFIPIALLSLFVFSAASTGYIFLYQPLGLLLEGQKEESIHLFLKTLAIFALSAAVLVLIGLHLTLS
jgi:hypothetical protein